MKKEKTLILLTTLPIILEIIAILFLPDLVPTHYSISLQVTQFGSKYLLLVLGGITLLFGVFIYFIYKAYRKNESQKIVFRLGMIALIVFNVINVLSLIGAFVLL